MATNTNPFYTYSATAGSSKTLQKPQDGGDNNQWGNYINTDLDEIVAAVNALSDKIADANENTLVDFTATGSAVNHVGITNAAAGNGPTISTAGTDSNVDLNLTPKGTGTVVVGTDLDVDNININGNTISSTDGNGDISLEPNGNGKVVVGTDIKFKDQGSGSAQTNLIELGHSASGDILKFVNAGSTDAMISLTDNGTFTVHSGGECDVQNAVFTTSSAQKQAIVQAGPGSGTLDVSSGTLTTSTAQKQAIVDGATIEAQDLASGSGTTLPNNVQDAITRLGTVTSGTFEGALSTNTTGGGVMSVGTVSESSGTPTGDIIQRGTVVGQGEYIRYADGTQICWITSILSSSSSDVTWTFPISFKTSSLNNIFGIANDDNRVVTLTTNNSTTISSVNFKAWGLSSSGYPFRSGAFCMLCAIGRWY